MNFVPAEAEGNLKNAAYPLATLLHPLSSQKLYKPSLTRPAGTMERPINLIRGHSLHHLNPAKVF